MKQNTAALLLRAVFVHICELSHPLRMTAVPMGFALLLIQHKSSLTETGEFVARAIAKRMQHVFIF